MNQAQKTRNRLIELMYIMLTVMLALSIYDIPSDEYVTINKNIEEIQTEQLRVKNIHRATDAKGKAFVEQAVAVMKMEKGSLFREKLM